MRLENSYVLCMIQFCGLTSRQIRVRPRGSDPVFYWKLLHQVGVCHRSLIPLGPETPVSRTLQSERWNPHSKGVRFRVKRVDMSLWVTSNLRYSGTSVVRIRTVYKDGGTFRRPQYYRRDESLHEPPPVSGRQTPSVTAPQFPRQIPHPFSVTPPSTT